MKSFPKDMPEWQAIQDNYNSIPLMEAPEDIVQPEQTQMPQPAMRNELPQAPQAPVQEMPEQASASDTEAPSLSKTEQLWQEYSKLMGQDREALKEARDRDRMLKVGGAIGDSLATIINARNQMNVAAPGVQVQQGAGLSKIADMFATSPEISDDLKSRREDLLAQYKTLAENKAVSPNAWQVVPLVKDGVQKFYRVNKITGETQEVGEKAAYLQFRKNAYTGETEALNPITGASFQAGAKPVKEETQDKIVQVRQSLNPNQRTDLKKTIDNFNKDTEKERDVMGSISSLRQTLDMAPDNAAAANAFGTQLAKLYQDGRLSDKDVDLYVKNKAVAQKIKSTFYNAVSGTMDPELVPVYKELIDEMAKGINQKIESKAQYFADQQLKHFIPDAQVRKGLLLPSSSYTQPSSEDLEPRVQKVMKNNPGATREQVIEVLKKQQKLPADYK